MHEVSVQRLCSAALLMVALAAMGVEPTRGETYEERIIIYGRPHGYQYGGVWSMRSDGSDGRMLAGGNTAEAWSPTVSPNGRRIAYAIAGPGSSVPNEIWCMDADGTDPFKVATIGPGQINMRMDWLDNENILFTQRYGNANGEIRAIKCDGTDNRVVVARPLFGQLQGYQPDVSPVANAPGGRHWIASVWQSGESRPTDDILLTDDHGENGREFYVDAVDDHNSIMPRFSRDGMTIFWTQSLLPGSYDGVHAQDVIVSKRLDSATPVSAWDAIVSPVNGHAQILQATSPDGTRLLYTNELSDVRALDLVSGISTTVFNGVVFGDEFGGDWEVVCIPEPATLLMLAGFAVVLRRR